MSISWTTDGKRLHVGVYQGSFGVACIRSWFGVMEAEENPSNTCQGLLEAGVETRADKGHGRHDCSGYGHSGRHS